MQTELELFFPLPYGPDLNAVERAWWYLRQIQQKNCLTAFDYQGDIGMEKGKKAP